MTQVPIDGKLGYCYRFKSGATKGNCNNAANPISPPDMFEAKEISALTFQQFFSTNTMKHNDISFDAENYGDLIAKSVYVAKEEISDEDMVVLGYFSLLSDANGNPVTQ